VVHYLGERVVLSRHFDGELSVFLPRNLDEHLASKPGRFGLLIKSLNDQVGVSVTKADFPMPASKTHRPYGAGLLTPSTLK
jgi:hypothetical protein